MKDSQETNLPIEESKLEEAKMPVTTPENTAEETVINTTNAESTTEKTVVSTNKLSKEEKQNCLSSVNSYLGIMSHYKTYNFRKKQILRYFEKWLKKSYCIPENCKKIMNICIAFCIILILDCIRIISYIL